MSVDQLDTSKKDTGMCPHGNFLESCVQCQSDEGGERSESAEELYAVFEEKHDKRVALKVQRSDLLSEINSKARESEDREAEEARLLEVHAQEIVELDNEIAVTWKSMRELNDRIVELNKNK